MASICSTTHSPRAAKAFSRACAARTWPAPEEAERRRTRGFAVGMASVGFAFAGGELFENSAAKFLEVAEAREIVLKFLVEDLRFLGAELRAENHVAKFDGMRKKGFFGQFFEGRFCVVVVHRRRLMKSRWSDCTRRSARAARKIGAEKVRRRRRRE